MADVAIDYGSVRTGLALCISQVVLPLEPLLRTTWSGIASRLEEVFSEYGQGLVVLGLPVSASGKPTALSEEVEKLGNWLTEKGFDVRFVNESCSTIEAREIRKGSRRDGRTDSLAAAILLKRYLNLP